MFSKLKVFVILISMFLLLDYQGKSEATNVINIEESVKKFKHLEYLDCKLYYKWLTKDVYNTIIYYCNYWSKIYKVDKNMIFALIQNESGDFCRNNIEKMIKVKSRSGALGICQIMPFHSPKNPKKLYDYKFNIKKGIWYFSLCMKKAKGDIKEAARFYNQGINGKKWKYKNWAYTNRIKEDFDSFNKMIFESKNLKLFALR